MGKDKGNCLWFKAVAAMFFAFLLLAPHMASAFDVQIHGYGNQDFIMSNKTDYFGGAEGTWEHNSMSLVFTANVTDDTSIWSKVFAESEKTTMEWLYVNKKLGHGFDARAGQMKMPLGLINLIRDMKFLHLAETEPSMYSNDVEVVHENFRGVGVEYNRNWLTIEVIGGAPELDESTRKDSELTAANEITQTTRVTEVRNLIGGRLKVKTPLRGLNLMFSASQFDEEKRTNVQVLNIATGTTTPSTSMTEGTEKLWIASLEYEHHNLELKAEYARKSGLEEKIISYYVEAGYTFFDKLIPYVRYDYIATDIYDKGNPANHQKDTTVGIGYKINEYVKVKAENHFMNGYALVNAQMAGEDPIMPDVAERWNMFVAGVNFMF